MHVAVAAAAVHRTYLHYADAGQVSAGPHLLASRQDQQSSPVYARTSRLLCGDHGCQGDPDQLSRLSTHGQQSASYTRAVLTTMSLSSSGNCEIFTIYISVNNGIVCSLLSFCLYVSVNRITPKLVYLLGSDILGRQTMFEPGTDQFAFKYPTHWRHQWV